MLPGSKLPKWRVLIVDSHHLFAAGVADILMRTEFEMIGTAGTATAAVLMADQYWPDIVLLDIRLEGTDRWELLELFSTTIPRTFPAAMVLLMTAEPDDAFRALALKSGLADYLDKGRSALVLLEMLRGLTQGDNALRPQDSVEPRVVSLALALTGREQDVLRQLTTGKSNRVIGQALFVSEETIKSHVACILHKLNVPGRTQAAVWAVQHGYNLLHSAPA